MQFVVIGTDHRMQAVDADCGMEPLIRAISRQRFFEPLVAIYEEWDKAQGKSVGERIADELRVHWDTVDMTPDEKGEAGILDEQVNRREFAPTARVPSDDVSERAWVEKLSKTAEGTIIVICGYVHFEAFVGKLREKGHAIDARVYLPQMLKIDNLTSEQLREIFRAKSKAPAKEPPQ
jgi:hypothetical protein